MLNAQLVYSSGSASLAPYLGTGRTAVAKPAESTEKAGQQAPAPTSVEKPSAQDTRKLVEDMNQALQQINTGLEFSQDEETGRTVVKLIDRETKETLRQFPSEETLAIAHALGKLKGVMIRQTA